MNYQDIIGNCHETTVAQLASRSSRNGYARSCLTR